jgi:hypothetical protein
MERCLILIGTSPTKKYFANTSPHRREVKSRAALSSVEGTDYLHHPGGHRCQARSEGTANVALPISTSGNFHYLTTTIMAEVRVRPARKAGKLNFEDEREC